MAKDPKGPSYYKRGTIDVWDFIRDQGLNFHLGNAIKYICRYGHKGNYNDQLKDLDKAIHYLQNERNHLEYSRNRTDAQRKDLPRPAPYLPNGASKGVPFDVSGWKFEESCNAD